MKITRRMAVTTAALACGVLGTVATAYSSAEYTTAQAGTAVTVAAGDPLPPVGPIDPTDLEDLRHLFDMHW